MDKPKCKCGRVCDYYGEIGGFSVACTKCNEKNAKRQREARAAKGVPPMTRPAKKKVKAGNRGPCWSCGRSISLDGRNLCKGCNRTVCASCCLKYGHWKGMDHRKKPVTPAPAKKKVKAGKVVKAWMAVPKGSNPSYYAYWTFDNKLDIEQPRAGTRFNPESDKWVRVLIVPAKGYRVTPAPAKRRKK